MGKKRKEQIEKAAWCNYPLINGGEDKFIQGAEWADANPCEANLAMYLGKKGWPLSTNGIPTYEEAAKTLDEYYEYKKKQWLEKGDESNLQSVLQHVSLHITSGKDMDYHCDLTDWIKSLKYRIAPQSRKTWNAEDITRLTKTISMLQEGASRHYDIDDVLKNINWLKALKDRILPQPKQEWSEEDENHKINTIHFLEASKKNFEKDEDFVYDEKWINACIDWLKSLKNRILPQPKQEWSEEDFKNLEVAIRCCDASGRLGIVQWLKTLKSKNGWKPSDEQMAALEDAIGEYTGEHFIALEQLYNSLKELKY